MAPSSPGRDTAEAHARFKQYSYAENASLVLTADREGKRIRGEPTGEAETLAGRIDPRGFGDRVRRAPEDEANVTTTTGKKKTRSTGDALEEKDALTIEMNQRRKRARADELLARPDDVRGDYRPKSRETRQAHEALLSLLSQQLGDVPADVLHGAADECLVVLKGDLTSDAEKRRAPDRRT